MDYCTPQPEFLSLIHILIEFKEIEFRGMTLTEEDLIQLFYYKFTETPLLKRMDAVKDYFIDSWETLKGRNISEDDQEMLQMKFDKMYTTKDIYTIYNWMLDDCGCDLLPEVPYEKRKLPYEDVFPMLYLKYRLSGGNSTHKNIKQMCIRDSFLHVHTTEQKLISKIKN